jgi:hypothetical protein
VGVAADVDDTSAGEEAGGEDEAAGVRVRDLAGCVIGQVETFVIVGDGCVGRAGLEVTGAETAVPAASGVMPVGLGVAPVAAGNEEATHSALEVGCGVGVGDFLDEVVVLPCPACPLPVGVPLGVGAPPPVGVPPPMSARVPLPSVPASPRPGPPSLFSEVLAWRIA